MLCRSLSSRVKWFWWVFQAIDKEYFAPGFLLKNYKQAKNLSHTKIYK